jgi:type II secretory pathway component PulF
VRYLVKYFVADITASAIVTIDDASDDIAKNIAKKLVINQSQIIKKSREWGAARKIIDNDDFLIILSTLEATHLSGSKTLEKSFIDSILDFHPKDKNLINQTKIWKMKGFSLMQMLRFVNIDKVIIVLLESGSSGNMSQALKEAKKYLKLSNEASGIYKTNVSSNITLSLVSLGLILGMPFMLVSPYNQIVKIRKIAEPLMVSLMNFIVNNIASIVVILSTILVFFIFTFINQEAFNKLKNLQPWKSLSDLKNLESAMTFLPIYTTLKKINYLDIDVVLFYKKIQKNIGNELVLCMTNKGQSLSQAITNTSLSKKLSQQMSAIFEIENADIRNKVIDSTIESLNTQIKKQAKKISTLMLLVKNFFLFVALLFFAGVYITGMLSLS